MYITNKKLDKYRFIVLQFYFRLKSILYIFTCYKKMNSNRHRPILVKHILIIKHQLNHNDLLVMVDGECDICYRGSLWSPEDIEIFFQNKHVSTKRTFSKSNINQAIIKANSKIYLSCTLTTCTSLIHDQGNTTNTNIWPESRILHLWSKIKHINLQYYINMTRLGSTLYQCS